MTVAPITGTIRGLSTEVRVGRRNGLEKDCVVSLDNIVTIPVDVLGPQIGYFLPDQEAALSEAVQHAFNLD